jgi:hypothetical protein
VEQRRVELLASALRTLFLECADPSALWPKLSEFTKNSNKNAAANKILTTTNYDLQIPILMNFGNELATEKIESIAIDSAFRGERPLTFLA